MTKISKVRLITLCVTALFHAALILFFHIGAQIVDGGITSVTSPNVMKLTNVTEYVPPARVKAPDSVEESTTENVAESITESDDAAKDEDSGGGEIEYTPQHKISVPPVFSESEIRKALTYPVIAQKSGIEGSVYLELFIDKDGNIRKITVLKEDPADRGFAEAAVNAFNGLKAVPAEANGTKVAVRYRYPVRFTLR